MLYIKKYHTLLPNHIYNIIFITCMYLLQYHSTILYNTHLFGRVGRLQFNINNSLNDSKDVNILSGRPSDRLFHDIFNTSRFFSEDML